MEIKQIAGQQILDSRGNPTVEAEVTLMSGARGRAASPSGASTGIHEAHELRDGAAEYGGKGVTLAVQNINNEISPALVGLRADDQFQIDQVMIDLDGTDNKMRLGANAILAVSLAVAHAAAAERQLPLYKHVNDIAHGPAMSLPMPMMNVLNGGRHASNSSDFQEFMVIPKTAATIAEAVRIGAEIFASLKSILSEQQHSTAVGDEGGFTYPVKNNSEMLSLLNKAVEKAGYKVGEDIVYALDVAASEFYADGRYSLSCEGKELGSEEMIQYLEAMAKNFPIASIEDGLDQDAWQDWTSLREKLSSIQLVGDDLLVTNIQRLNQAIEQRAGNSILIKPNQIGTLTETIRAVQAAKASGWTTIISHRSGETEDVSIAHLAVGLGAGQIKTGSLSRSDRTAKYNELMRIEAADNSLKLSKPF